MSVGEVPFCTLTVQEVVSPESVVAVIEAVPADFARTVPFADTVAMSAFEDE